MLQSATILKEKKSKNQSLNDYSFSRLIGQYVPQEKKLLSNEKAKEMIYIYFIYNSCYHSRGRSKCHLISIFGSVSNPF